MYREVDEGSPCSVSILKYVIIARMWLICSNVACQSFKISLFLRPKKILMAVLSEIRTYASEETGA